MTKLQQLAPDDHRHGTVNGYVHFMCRCDACRAAHSTYQKDAPVHAAMNGTLGHYTLTDAGRRAIARDDHGRLDVRRYLELLDGTVAP